MVSAPLPAASRLRRMLPGSWPLPVQVIVALALALLPLLLLAVVSAVDAYRDLRESQAVLARTRLETLRREVGGSLDQQYAILQALLLEREGSPEGRAGCDRAFTRLAQIDPLIASIVRVDADGGLVCASSGGPLPPVTIAPSATGTRPGPARTVRVLLIDEASPDRDLILGVRSLNAEDGGDSILARLPRMAVQQLIRADLLRRYEYVRLLRFGEPVAAWGGDRGDPLREIDLDSLENPVERLRARNGAAWFVSSTPLDLPGLRLALARPAPAISGTQALNVALPILMWAVAVTIGWAAINWLVVRPLGRLQRGVDRYAAGDASVRLGGAFVSHEMEQFGTAFDRMADQIDAHEGELRDALATQKKLTREVHHRVKNNLQIVSSLLSLQSRDATSPEVAYAYATIQKRVNALALVHRWLFDDEAMRGVDMKSLTHDLCAGLEQSVAQAEGANISITADVERIFVGQDTAVPLAFLITEFVTAAARLGDKAPQALRVSARAEGERAALTFEAPPFRGRDPFAQGSGDPAARIVQGMTRQMRSKLVHDAARGRYSIDFPVAKG